MRSLVHIRTSRKAVYFGVLGATCLAGCAGPQSTLAPQGPAAEQILALFWWMLGGGAVIWLSVVLLALYAIVWRRDHYDIHKVRLYIIGGGVVMPTIILSVLLAYGLSLLPPLIADAPEGSLTIEVDGVRWWWRVRYHDGINPQTGDVRFVETANEIRLPTGEPIQFILRSDDVIHSFWIPALGGKLDMIPGRVTRLMLEASEPTHVRGVCAEYCGAAHAVMNFDVVTLEPDDFDAWMANQRRDAAMPSTPLTEQGQELFLSSGCGACHAVRGTAADGVVGPDLTHIGGRPTIGAGMLPTTVDNLVRWIGHTDQVKPGVEMPAFDTLSEDQLHAVATYLESLK